MIRRQARWLTACTVSALVLTTLPAGAAPALAHELTPALPSASPGHGASPGHSASPGHGSKLKIGVDAANETAQGAATTIPLPGSRGDYVRLHAMGTVGVSTADGQTVWQTPARSLVAAWHLRYSPSDSKTRMDPQVPLVRDSANPFLMFPASQEGVADLHPVAAGYLAGSRVPDVAIAEIAGHSMLGGDFAWSFTVPGSRLHYGSFVTVLNGATGQVLYSELEPGYVTQLAITGGRLIVGDETGDPATSLPSSPMGAWRTVTTVRALSFHPTGARLAASTAWTYSTHAPWAILLGLTPAGQNGQNGQNVAVSWSDTPEGLGVPGPPGGHVVLIRPDGTVAWNVATPGYPMLSQYDPHRGLLVVAGQTDPSAAIGYTLAGLRLSDGSTAVAVRVPHVLPTAMTATGGTWFAAGVITTVRKAAGIGALVFSAGQVTAVDPDRGQALWSVRLASSPGHKPYPAALLTARLPGAGSVVLAASGTGFVGQPRPSDPITQLSSLIALSGADGHQLWERSGDVADPLSVRLAGPSWQPYLAGITDQQDAVSYNLATGAPLSQAPLMGELDAAVPAQIGGQRVIIAGSQSGGVYALDPADLSRVLWQTDAGGPVHQVALARPTPGAPPVVVVAATNRVDVLDLDTGQIRLTRAFGGQFVWTLTVGPIGTHPSAVVVATSRLTAFDPGTGQTLWTYRPPVPAYFSNTALVDGTTVAEYQSHVVLGSTPATMVAVGIGPTGAVAWTAPASSATTSRAMLWNGVIASPHIAAGGPTGVALSWQNSKGNGRVDVRDAVTGALLYRDTSSSLGNHQAWAVDPRLGLIAIGASESALIEPGRPATIESVNGTAATVVGTATDPVLVVADNTLTAYPAGTLTSLRHSTGAPNDTLLPGTAVPVGPAAGGQFLTLPTDETAWAVIYGTEEGNLWHSPASLFETGIDLLTVTGTAPASTPTATKTTTATAPPAPRPTALAAGTRRPGIGTAMPLSLVQVHGYTRAGLPVLTEAAPSGYSPAAIRAYLGLSGDGSGQTVAVVDAFADPALIADVNHFSRQFGLPTVCGTKGAGPQCFDFTVSAPDGTAGEDPGWALETSLDIEWIHAVAPKAAVRLVEGHDSTFAAMFRAVTSAAALHPDTISMSWGEQGGEFSGESYYDWRCKLAQSVCVVAAGDDGYPGEYPAYNPDVLAIGGTTLELAASGTVSSEVAWSGSGGGRSYFEPQPAAQQGVTPHGSRGLPDVSFDADPSTGVPVYDSIPFQGGAGWFQVGGTSVGAPVWSAILASADQLRAAAGKARLTAAGDTAARAVYGATAALADITTGPPNGPCPDECHAQAGYDYVTGVGSPRAGIDTAIAAAP